MTFRQLVFGLVALSCLSGISSAQVVREDGVKSIAGIVGGGNPGYVEWTFKSEGGEVLFATLDAFIYERREPDGGHVTPAEEGGGCTGEGGCSGEGGGCSGDAGGPSRLCLQVINSLGAVICSAKRPIPPPGWQRDPRLACALPRVAAGQADYRIRVVQVSMGGEEQGPFTCDVVTDGLTSPDPYPFLLNVSLRRLAPPGLNIQAAVAQSGNRF